MQYNITYRQKDKNWQFIISYKDNTGKWKQKSKQGFKSKGLAKIEADKFLEKLKKDLDTNSFLDHEHQGITFKDFADMFIEHEKLYKEDNTISTYITALKAFNTLNDFELSKIKTMDIQRCVDNLTKNKLKYSTIKLYLTKINVLFGSAKNKYKIISKNPIISIDIQKNKSTNEKIALTSNELNNLLSKINNKEYYLISVIAAKCGLRLGEILGLTWIAVDEKKCTINVTKQWKRLKDNAFGFGELKSKNSRRTVPLPPKVLNELLKFKNDFPRNIDGRIFKYRSSNSISEMLNALYKKLGFSITIHELRHTYATLLISNGVDFKTAAQLLGHDIEQTMKTYAHVTTDMLSNASKIINSIF